MENLPSIFGTIPGWITAAGTVALLGVVVRGLSVVLAWLTKNREITLADDKDRRGEGRGDLHDCQTRLDAMGQRLDVVEATAHSFELKLTAALIAYRIIEVAHEAIEPNSVAVQQARAVFSTAFTVSEVPEDILELSRKVA